MKWIDRLERRWGKYAIPNLIRWIVTLNVIGYIAIHTIPNAESVMVLDSGKVMQGQIWRLVSYLFIPPSPDPIWIFFI